MWRVTSLARGGNRKYVLRVLSRFGVLLYLWKQLICSTRCVLPADVWTVLALLIDMLEDARIFVIISVTCFLRNITYMKSTKWCEMQPTYRQEVSWSLVKSFCSLMAQYSNFIQLSATAQADFRWLLSEGAWLRYQWDLWRTKWYWQSGSGFPLPFIVPPMFHIHHSLGTSIIGPFDAKDHETRSHPTLTAERNIYRGLLLL